MNNIIAVNWQATEPHWTADSSPFDRKFSLILVYDASGLVAFSVYRKLRIAGGRAIYRSGTEVLPAHQGRGLYGFFTTEILRSSGAADNGDSGVLYGWRTRNPIVWAANARICEKDYALAARRHPGSPRCRRPASRCVPCFIPASASKYPA